MQNRRNRAREGNGRRSTFRLCPLPVGAVARAFLDARCASLTSPQVVQLGTPHLALPSDFQRLDQRRVQREDALDADPRGNPPNREIGGRPGSVGTPDAHTLESLHTLPGALTDPEVDPDRVARLECGDVFVYFWANKFRCFHNISARGLQATRASKLAALGDNWTNAAEIIAQLCRQSVNFERLQVHRAIVGNDFV